MEAGSGKQPVFAALPKSQADFAVVAPWLKAKPGKRTVITGGKLRCLLRESAEQAPSRVDHRDGHVEPHSRWQSLSKNLLTGKFLPITNFELDPRTAAEI